MVWPLKEQGDDQRLLIYSKSTPLHPDMYETSRHTKANMYIAIKFSFGNYIHEATKDNCQLQLELKTP